MSNGRITTTLDRIEQAWSRGLLPDEIATTLGVRLAEVLRVGEAMDKVALHTDDPRAAFGDNCRKGLHALSPENLYIDPRGRRFCRPCKSRHQRDYDQRRQQRAAS